MFLTFFFIDGYVDGMGLYGAYFALRFWLDPSGAKVLLVDAHNNYDESTNDKFKDTSDKWFKVNEAIKKNANKVKAIDNAKFEKLKSEGKVLFNGEKWTKSQDEYVKSMLREIESKAVKQINGDIEDFLSKLKSFSGKIERDYDELGAMAHGCGTSIHFPDSFTEKGEAIKKMRKTGLGTPGIFVIVTCKRDGFTNESWNIRQAKFKLTIIKKEICGISFDPYKISKRMEGHTVDLCDRCKDEANTDDE